MGNGGVRSTSGEADGASWDEFKRAICERSRGYRPGKVCDRPQMREREAGKPKRRQLDVLEDTAAGRAATRLSRKSSERAAPHDGGAAVQGGNAQAGLPLAGPRDATAGTQNLIGRAKGVRRATAGRVRHEPDDRPAGAGAMGDEGQRRRRPTREQGSRRRDQVGETGA